MRNTVSRTEPGFGFLTVLGSAEGGLMGGLLVLNRLGRPLEFHCTAPVRPNRAQQILYGPTLLPYLFGEQIGATLVSKTKADVRLYFVNQSDSLAMRPLIDRAVALVCPLGVEPAGDKVTDEPGALPAFEVAGHRLAVDFATAEDRGRIEQICRELPAEFDLHEPFERISEAIAEAQRAA